MQQIVLSIFALAFVNIAFADYKLYEGEQGEISAGLQLQTASFSEINNQSGGAAKANLSDFFLDMSAKPYLNTTLNLSSESKLYGGFSYIYSSTWGHDPSGYTEKGLAVYQQETDYMTLNTYNNYRYKNMTEELYIGWNSEKLFNNWNNSTVDLSLGKQNYTLGSGFLLFYGADNGGNRGASWVNPRTAFNNTLIARINVNDIKLEGFHLQTRPLNPAEKRIYDGVNIEYSYSDTANFAFSYINTRNKRLLHDIGSTVFLGESVVNNDTYNARADFSPLDDLTLSAEYAYQINTETINYLQLKNKSNVHASGGFGQIDYKFQNLYWQPTLSYRYAIQNAGFDSMSPGFKTWGSWFQGEITGEFILDNANLMTHQAKFILTPSESVTFSLIYLNYKFINPELLALNSENYGNEVNLLTDWDVNDSISLSAGIEAFIPNEAGTQYLGGNKMWLQAMVSASFEF